MSELRCPHCNSELRYFSDSNIEYDSKGNYLADANLENYWVECSECEKNSNDDIGFLPALNEFLDNL